MPFEARVTQRRRIAVLTGSRAEYGLLFWLLREIEADDELELVLLVTGSHLSPEFGLTYTGIEGDGFRIDAKIEMLLSSDTAVGVAKSMGLATIGCAEALDRLHPDLLVVLGDRYEVLAAVQAALLARVPVAHLHGGEATEGAIDEGIRHAVTKLSHLHFTAAEDYRRRVVQLGEAPERVFDVGAIGIDAIANTRFMGRAELEESLGISLGQPTFLITYHPVTLAEASPAESAERLFRALDAFPDAHLIFTGTNADPSGRVLATMIESYAASRAAPAVVHKSLGQARYLSTVGAADLVLGNSSSALIEVPAMHKAAVNIGSRQQGRLVASSVVSCPDDIDAIIAAIRETQSPSFQAALADVRAPYGLVEVGAPSVASRIKSVLKNYPLQNLILKRFHDLPA